jgi:hypothetical protein
MITKETLIHGEGELLEGDPKIGSRKMTSQSEEMASECDQNGCEFMETCSGCTRS